MALTTRPRTRLDVVREDIRTDRMMLAVVEAARESLKGGEHSGPCTNEGDEFSTCDMHDRWAGIRHANLIMALAPFSEEMP